MMANGVRIFQLAVDTWTHIDHSIGGDAEESGSLVDGLQFISAVGGGTQIL